MVLSHGNAAVEGGFSISKELLIDNMLEETVAAQRVVFDAIRKAGMDIKNVDITLNMGMSAAHCQGNVRKFQSVWRVVTLYIHVLSLFYCLTFFFRFFSHHAVHCSTHVHVLRAAYLLI